MKRAFFFCLLPIFLLTLAPSSWPQILDATSESGEKLVQVNMATKAVTVLYNIGARPDSLIINPQGQIFYTVQNLGTVSVFDPSTSVNTVLATGLSFPRDLVFDPGGSSLLVSNFGKGEIDRIDILTAKLTPLAIKLGTVDGLAYDSGGLLFAVIRRHTQVAQIDPVTGAILKTLAIPTPLRGWWGLDGLTFDPFTGNLWATDVGTGANCLAEIPTDLSKFTLFQVNNIPTPDGIVSDGTGNLFVGSGLINVFEYSIPLDKLTAKVRVGSVDDVALVPPPPPAP